MTSAQLALALYGWLANYAPEVFAMCIGVPLVGVSLCALMRQSRRRGTRGQWLGNATLWCAVGVLALALVLVALARALLDVDLTRAPLLLLAGPPVGAVIAIVGMHWTYPLNQLAAWRTLTDIGWFVLASSAVIWLVSQFRGWGILFGASVLELAAIAIFVAWLLRRLYRRALR